MSLARVSWSLLSGHFNTTATIEGASPLPLMLFNYSADDDSANGKATITLLLSFRLLLHLFHYKNRSIFDKRGTIDCQCVPTKRNDTSSAVVFLSNRSPIGQPNRSHKPNLTSIPVAPLFCYVLRPLFPAWQL
jgi:hypothetical protein